MTMTDFNSAEAQRDGATIPDGTYCMVRMSINPGRHSMPNLPAQDQGLFKLARSSDAVMLDCAFTVLFGPHAKRQIFQNFTVDGGSRNEDGSSKAWNISKRTFRAVLESAMGVDPKDESAQAKAVRSPPGFYAMNGLEFQIRVSVETDPNGQYPPKNQIAHVVTPDEAEYALLKRGEIPPPLVRIGGGVRVAAPGGVTPTPAWQQAAAPATAQRAVAAWQQQVPGAIVAQPPTSPPQATWSQPANQPTPQQQPQPTAEPAAATPAKGPSWVNNP